MIKEFKNHIGMLIVAAYSLAIVFHANRLAGMDIAPQVELPIELQILPGAIVARPEITLADVAECVDYGDICDESSGVVIGPSPQPGESVEISNEQIFAVARQEWEKSKLVLKGAASIKVSASAATIDTHEVRKAIEESFLRLEDTKVRYELVASTILNSPRVRPGNYRITVDTQSITLNQYQTTHTLTGACITEFNESFPFKVMVQLRRRYLGLVAARNLNAGEVVQEEDLQETWSISQGGASNISERQQIIGRQLKNRISKGQGFSGFALQHPIAIKRGTIIDLVIDNAGFNIKTKGEALADGALGQSVNVKVISNKKEISAVVLDRTTAKVSY